MFSFILVDYLQGFRDTLFLMFFEEDEANHIALSEDEGKGGKGDKMIGQKELDNVLVILVSLLRLSVNQKITEKKKKRTELNTYLYAKINLFDSSFFSLYLLLVSRTNYCFQIWLCIFCWRQTSNTSVTADFLLVWRTVVGFQIYIIIYTFSTDILLYLLFLIVLFRLLSLYIHLFFVFSFFYFAVSQFDLLRIRKT